MSMNENSKQYRRDLLTSWIRTGGVHEMIADARKRCGSSVVVVVASTQSDPGRTFLRHLLRYSAVDGAVERDLRRALTGSDGLAVTLVLPADTFVPAANHYAESLTDALKSLLSRSGVVPVAVMGGDGVMTVGIADVEPDGTLPAAQPDCPGRVWSVACPDKSSAFLERQRRTDRQRRYGMN